MKTVDLLLEESQLSLAEFAQRASLTAERAAAIADGRWLPSPAERSRIAEALDAKVEEISWGHTMDPRNVRYRRFGFKDS